MTDKNIIDFNLNVIDGISSIITGYYIYFLYSSKVRLGFIDIIFSMTLI